MTLSIILGLFHSFGLVIFVLGVQAIAFVPLTLVYEAWKKRFMRIVPRFSGRVTVLIPAYNEEKTIRATIVSVLDSTYPEMEVIVIDDGSTDGTQEAIADFVSAGRIKYIKKPNGGKASALNMGIEAASGDVVIFTDADSIFLPDTVEKMARWFGDPSIDAVCGSDAPLHPATPIQKFLAVTTHIGTGFVRRALSIIRCLPIITGNLGAVRTGVLREIGGFREIWGEDLEVTFRLYRHRKRIIFDPEPKVMAECPGTFSGLWKQRIRWVRSYIKISLLHRSLFFNARYSPFSFYLPVNFVNMTIVPLLQLALLVLIPWAYMAGHLYFIDTVEVLSFLGIFFFFGIAFYSVVLDGDYSDVRYIPYGLLILPLSYFYNVVVIYSWYMELRGSEEKWHKVERKEVFTASHRRWRYAAIAFLLVASSSAVTYYAVSTRGPALKSEGAFSLGLSTHFDAWGDWRKAVSNVTGRRDVALARVVGVSAGRPEWTYFKWKGHENVWSNHQKGAKEDMLDMATTVFHRRGFKVAAFIDIYGPAYIKRFPSAAAVGFDGKRNTEQISFMEIMEGNWGEQILEMVSYLAENYAVDIINLTETPYYTYSYNREDLASYSAFTGRKAWPRLPDGTIDRDDPSIWEWRSTLMEAYIEKAAAAAHRYGKQLYVDVPVSWKDFKNNGRESGLDYRRVLRHADNIVVWDYFLLEGLPPSSTETLSRYLVRNFPADSFYISLGLWGKDGAEMTPEELKAGLSSALKGGATRVWVTPDSMITAEHWNDILEYLRP
ncbi:MAG: glycosyltransferase [Thermodesulfobacteriota bacterium]